MAHIKDSHSYHFSATIPKRDINMPMAVAIALGVHAFVIFGISFAENKSPAAMAQEVATVLTQNTEENEHARFIANASQEGSGEVRQQLRLETNDISSETADDMQDVQDFINLQKQVRQQAYQQSYLRTTLSVRHTKNDSDNKNEKELSELEAQEERIRKNIQTLEAQLSQRQQVFASKTKVETVDSNSTTHGKAAAYLENFRTHVERVANQYYPEQARAQRITGDVRLMVIINADGTVKAIRLLESSGSVILDEAAKQSVRQSAPYGRFGSDMKDIVELRVVRTWRYSDKIEVGY
ncbi:MAG: energy transducer TonB [Moraxella sp.]|nr:energy transducer TonB [Moraxella sp.]